MKAETKQLLCFLVGWTILNLIQAALLDINLDEAYAVFWSQKLQWGYFDHPPVLGFFIRLSSWLFPYELGARFPSVVMSTLSIYLLWKLSDSGDLKLFLKIILSIIAVHTMAFHAFPEIPLVFFCLVYLFYLKKYLATDSLYLALPISLSMALMFLSKYTAILIPAATLMAAPSLLKRKSFWLIAFLSTVFLIPHVLWQVETDFMSLRFHLVDRYIGMGFSIKSVWKYVINQPLLTGPIVGFFLIFIAIRYRAENSFEKVLKAILYVVYGFFFLSTFKGGVLRHWTALAVIPVIVLGVRRIEGVPGLRDRCHKFLNVSFIVSMIAFTVVRVFLAYELIPHQYVRTEYLHGFRTWAKNIQIAAQQCPVVFVNTYELPSRYMFYSNQYAHCLSTLSYRRSEFDLREDHRRLFGKRVMLINAGDTVLEAGNGKTYHNEFHDHFATYPGIRIVPQELEYSIRKEARTLDIPIRVSRNPYSQGELGICKSVLTYGILNRRGVLVQERELEIGLLDLIEAKDWTVAHVSIPSDAEEGSYVRFGIKTGSLPSTLNSNTVVVKEHR